MALACGGLKATFLKLIHWNVHLIYFPWVILKTIPCFNGHDLESITLWNSPFCSLLILITGHILQALI